MNEIKFITFSDVHISDVNPVSRTGDYRQDILDKLNLIRRLGEKMKVDFFLCAGDLYHNKPPSKNSHLLNTKLTVMFKSYPAPVYMIEGNHDLKNDSYDTFDKQPLSVLYSSNTLVRLPENDVIISDKNSNISMRIRSFPFIEEPDFTNKDIYPTAKKDVDFNVCALHLYASPSGGSLFGAKMYSYGEISTLGDDVFLLGHYHKDQGILNKDGKIFINLGAISRGSLSDDNINRVPRISLVTCSKEKSERSIKTQIIKLKVKPSSEVFKIEERKKEIKKMEEAKEFVSKLKENVSDNVDVRDTSALMKRISEQKLNVDKAVIKKLEYYINEADTMIGTIKR